VNVAMLMSLSSKLSKWPHDWLLNGMIEIEDVLLDQGGGDDEGFGCFSFREYDLEDAGKDAGVVLITYKDG
jgi:hypothetical protein